MNKRQQQPWPDDTGWDVEAAEASAAAAAEAAAATTTTTLIGEVPPEAPDEAACR